MGQTKTLRSKPWSPLSILCLFHLSLTSFVVPLLSCFFFFFLFFPIPPFCQWSGSRTSFHQAHRFESVRLSVCCHCMRVCVLCVSVCLCVSLCCVCQRATQSPSVGCALTARMPACEQARVSGVDASVTILHQSPAGSDHNQRIISFSGNDSSLFNASPVSLTQPVPLANKSSPFAINASSISPQTEAVQRPESNFQNRDASEIPHSRMARGAIQLSPKESRRAGTQDSDQAKETRQSESSERGTSRQCITNASPSPSQRWAPYVIYTHTHNS